ncbi:O-antigen ligase family protein [Fulvivirga sediminis]|uniref:O-antigen ligase family protein n=1 Tax=Fulvivirga sediminis TaxID=2803949 RepID=A0A937JYU8_9BACT|nr:O-antigen ligase family protein [Fulvivirga sediminis]MBL3656783.1 O-antigen ligase family protein [Fulvivirga sediminis]
MQKQLDIEKFSKKIYLILTIIMAVKIAGFFTWSENVAITRVFKVFSRIMMTIAAYYAFKYILKKGGVDSFKWNNVFSPLLYGGYLLLGFISFMWSTKPSHSSLQWFMDLESFVFCYYYMKSFEVLEVFFPKANVKFYHILANASFLIILIFIIGLMIAPDEFYRMTHGGEEARLGGYMMNPNELGMLCVVSICCYIFNLYRNHRKVWTIIKILLVLYALILTGSRSSMIGFLLVVFFHIRQSDNIKLKLAINVGAVFSIPVIVQTIFIKQGDVEEVLSMTGRLPFWTALLNEGLPREPWFGFGFMRIAYKDYFKGVHTYAGQMTHNTFIQVLMNLGFVGFGLVLLQMIATIRGFLNFEDKEKKLMLLGILIPIIINSFTEFGIFGETNYGILFYQLLIFGISFKYHPILSRSEKLYLRRTRPDLSIP